MNFEEMNKDLVQRSAEPFFLGESSIRCLGHQNVFKDSDRRACRFKHICYQRSTKEFIYFQKSKPRPVWYDKSHGPMLDFQGGGKAFINLGGNPFSPDASREWKLKVVHLDNHQIIKEWNELPKKIVKTTSAYFTWSFDDINFGHFVYEDLGSVFTSLRRFGIQTKVELYSQRGPNSLEPKAKERYDKFSSIFMPVVSDHSVHKLDDEDTICFTDFVIGGHSRLFFNHLDPFNEGKEALFKSYRDSVLDTLGFDPQLKLPPVTSTKQWETSSFKILLLEKKQSEWLPKSKRNINNIKHVAKHLKVKFPFADVEIMDPTAVPLKDQIKQVLSSKILISPAGGISMIAPFLAVDSHAIFMDYYGSSHTPYDGYNDGESASMEAGFWNLWPHINVHYYQIYDPKKDMIQDYHSGDPERDSYRDAYSVVVDINRIEFMVRDIVWQELNQNQFEESFSKTKLILLLLVAVLCYLFFKKRRFRKRFDSKSRKTFTI